MDENSMEFGIKLVKVKAILIEKRSSTPDKIKYSSGFSYGTSGI